MCDTIDSKIYKKKEENKNRVNVTAETLTKLTWTETRLTEEDMIAFGRFIVAEKLHDSKENFIVAKSINQIKAAISNYKDELFIIFKLNTMSRWALMYLQDPCGAIDAYFIDPFYEVRNNNAYYKIMHALGQNSIPYILPEIDVIQDEFDDYLPLAYLELMINLNFNDFIYFKLPKVAKVKSMKNILREKIIDAVRNDVFLDLKDENFVAQIETSLGKLNSYFELSQLTSNYQKVLETEAANLQILEDEEEKKAARDRIEKARSDLMSNSRVKELSNAKFEIKDGTFHLKDQQPFVNEMQSFGTFLKILYNAADKDKSDRLLQWLSAATCIDIETLKKFLVTIEKEEKKPVNPDDVQTKPVTGESDKDVKCLTNILDKMVIEDQDKTAEEVRNKIINEYNQVYAFYEDWKTKDVKAIRKWFISRKGKVNRYNFIESIAVLMRANALVTGYNSLQCLQILTLLFFYQMDSKRGTLFEMLGGEEKTTVVSIFAVLKILMGDKFVDIVTMSDELAEEGMKNRKEFYSVFDVTVGCNNKIGGNEMKECYKADICYGTIQSFQVDYIKQNFSNQELRGNRSFAALLLDEVDCIALDNGRNIMKIKEQYPGMDSIKYAYLKIWHELVKYEEKINAELTEKIKVEVDKLKQQGLTDEQIQEKVDILQADFLKNAFSGVKEAVKASNPTDVDVIQPHLRDYATQMTERWIDNAMYAKYQCFENIHYIIKKNSSNEDAIFTVDYQNTGSSLKTDEAHQFLQLKHCLNLTVDSHSSSFISNIGYLKLYKNNLIGVSKSLGSDAECSLLSEAYNCSYVRIPSQKTNSLIEEEGMIVADDTWAECVALDALIRTKKQQSVLIICHTIMDAIMVKKMVDFLKEAENFNELKITTFIDEKKVPNVTIGKCEIIIAMDTVGYRGLLKPTDELEANGGLHVCVAFIPKSSRIQKQAFALTAKNGKKGSAQVIAKGNEIELLGESLDELFYSGFDAVETIRDDAEEVRLMKIHDNELPLINFLDEMQFKFLEYYGNVNDNLFSMMDLKEFWAIWLQLQNYKDVKEKKVEEEFKKFKDEVKKSGKDYKNPFYYIAEAEHLMEENRRHEAKSILLKAVNKAKNLYAAYIKLFEISIENGGAVMEKLKKAFMKVIVIGFILGDDDRDPEYKVEAKKFIENAKIGLKKEIDYIRDNIFNDDFAIVLQKRTPYSNLFEEPNDKSEDPPILPLVDHLKSRFVALAAIQQHCDSLYDQVDEADNVVVQTRIPNYFKTFTPENSNEIELKKALLPMELDELSLLGLDVIYSLTKIHDVPNEIIIGAQVQILAGLASLATGVAFPFLMPILGPIAGALISEGICDIVFELISQVGQEFDWKTYAKEKAISFGIAIATAGISALASSVKLLTKAMKALKKVADILRKSTKLKTVCELIARGLEKFAEKIKKIIAKAQFVTKAPEEFLLKTVIKNIAKDTLFDVAFGAFTELATKNILDEILKGLKPKLQEDCDMKVKEIIPGDVIKNVNMERIGQLLSELMNEDMVDMITDIAKEISLGILNAQKSWKIKLAGVVIDAIITTIKLTEGVNLFCEKLKNEFTKETKSQEDQPPNDHKYKTIAVFLSEHMYTMIMKIVLGATNTFIVKPTISKLSELLNNHGKEKKVDDDASLNDAYKLLDLKPGASEQEIKAKYRKLALENHPDKGGSADVFVKITFAKNKLLSSIESKNNFTTPAKDDDDKQKMAHAGNIKTLSNSLEVHLKISEIDPETNTVKQTHNYGEHYKSRDSIELEFIPRKNDQPGHYKLKSDGKEVTIPSGKNNCFYDAVETYYNNKGVKRSAQDLRKIAESKSAANMVYDNLDKVSHLLNNPITRDLFVKAQNSLLVGGFNENERLIPKGQEHRKEANYPGGKIKYNEDIIKNDMTNVYNEFVSYKNSTAKDYEKQKNVKGHDFFQSDLKLHGNRGTMIGVLKTVLVDGNGIETEYKTCTLSGDNAFKFRNGFGDKEIAGYKFVNKGFVKNVKGDERDERAKVYNFDTNEETTTLYKKSCAAVKLHIDLAEHMQHPDQAGYRVKTRTMAECWYKVGTPYQGMMDKENFFERLAKSCDQCECTLDLTNNPAQIAA